MPPLFTARHYDKLAKIIAAADRYDDGELIGPGLASDIVNMLAEDNPEFNRPLFEKIAGLNEDEDGADPNDELREYAGYCAAKREIGEEPLLLSDWREFNALASER